MNLLSKYNIPGPRYTSYPTVPHWEEAPSKSNWHQHLQKGFHKANTKGMSLYVHLPFCEEFCTYCACNKVITKNHDLEKPYLDALIQEWRMYQNVFPGKPKIREIHLGGGTPTFFSAENLRLLFSRIISGSDVADDAEFSVEIHPMQVTYEQLIALHEAGVERISLGIQDVDPVVQESINRVQPKEKVNEVMGWIREIGFTGVNFDLIYGLPFQTPESIRDTMEFVAESRPSRIAFYSYAHVPWKKNAQRRFSEEDLPLGNDKLLLFEIAKKLLEDQGYLSIGMDHFALPDDALAQAYYGGDLHRNFMGYTTTGTDWLIGLGASSISETEEMYIQNEKNTFLYQKKINTKQSTIVNGHMLNDWDRAIKEQIMRLMCDFQTKFENLFSEGEFQSVQARLSEMENDGLVGVFKKGILLSEKGRPFVRNVCMALDYRLLQSQPGAKVFSRTI